jgi:hypothetical protein
MTRTKREQRKGKVAMCPFHDCDGKTPGRVWIWGRVTHKHKVKVCRAHEQVYRDYGWIRVYRKTERPKGRTRI